MNKLIKFAKKILIIAGIFYLALLPIKTTALEVKNQEIIGLEEKIAKGYSSKFCNAIGIGLSTEAATRLTINENKNPKFNPSLWLELTLSGEKNLSKVDQNLIPEIVSSYIIRDCGYPIGLSGEEGIKAYKDYFISIQRELKESENQP